jgi:tRNA G10  N-methylase Trm11
MIGINFKKKYQMKRFKQVDILHTDVEVKNKGIELIKIKGEYGIVQGYQNIKLYEIVDFEKPARSMQVGMMPAKLTHSLINIALSYTNKNKETLIFDPFCGTGTTGCIANYFGYNFVGSDIKPNLALKNQERRETSKYFQKKIFQIQEQDISKPLDPTKFNELLNHNTLIVTEGRL